MELILAIVVASAVIFFGALISVGNERQRRAIDDLREQATLWAIQDLRIKRERLARDVRVDDPLGWLNRMVAKSSGLDLRLQVEEACKEPQALICSTGDGDHRIVFAALSPDQIRKVQKGKRSRLSQSATSNLLFSLPRRAKAYEISSLNGGIMFDLELPLAWQGLTGQKVDHMERLWIYVVS